MAEAMTRLKVEAIEREEARKGANFLERAIALEHAGLFLTSANGKKVTVEMPPTLMLVLKTLLRTLADTGEALVLSPDLEISPENAAEILGISRPLVYQRMDAGKLPFRSVGTHRRVRVDDVVALKKAEDERRALAAALSADTEDLEANYAKPGQSSS